MRPARRSLLGYRNPVTHPEVGRSSMRRGHNWHAKLGMPKCNAACDYGGATSPLKHARSEPMFLALPFILAALAVLVVGVQILLVVKVADLFEAPRDERQDVRKVHARYPAVPAGRYA